MLSPTRDADGAERFFRQVLQASHTLTPRVITVDKNAAYPPAFEALQREKTLPETCQLRQCKYLNNIIEQDHRFVKRRVNPGLGFGTFAMAKRTIQGYEAMHMLRKGQLEDHQRGWPRPEPRHQPAVRVGRITRARPPPLTLQSVLATQPRCHPFPSGIAHAPSPHDGGYPNWLSGASNP